MYSPVPINGESLPPKTLCLTFSDGPGETPTAGPGPRSVEIAEYLAAHGIRATFFVTGKHVTRYPRLIEKISSKGHLIANQTYDFVDLVHLHAVGGDVASQLLRADSIIRNHIDGSVIFFRPPYLSWSPGLANDLNKNLLTSLGHVGPVGTDLNVHDYEYWANLKSPEECAEETLAEISHLDHGIISMHDSTADQEYLLRRNLTFRLTELLIPKLQANGYRFVRLDEIPIVQTLSGLSHIGVLRGPNGKYVSHANLDSEEIMVNAPIPTPSEFWVVENAGAGRVALRVPNGNFLSVQKGGGAGVIANGLQIDDWERLDLIQVSAMQYSFRSAQGYFLTSNTTESGSLQANATLLDASCVFTFEPV